MKKKIYFEIAEIIRTELEKFPEIIKYSASTGQGGGGDGNTIDIKIYGHDFNTTNKLTLNLPDKIKNVEGARDIKINEKTIEQNFRLFLIKKNLPEMV